MSKKDNFCQLQYSQALFSSGATRLEVSRSDWAMYRSCTQIENTGIETDVIFFKKIANSFDLSVDSTSIFFSLQNYSDRPEIHYLTAFERHGQN